MNIILSGEEIKEIVVKHFAGLGVNVVNFKGEDPGMLEFFAALDFIDSKDTNENVIVDGMFNQFKEQTTSNDDIWDQLKFKKGQKVKIVSSNLKSNVGKETVIENYRPAFNGYILRDALGIYKEYQLEEVGDE